MPEPPHAEVIEVWPRDRAIRIVGSLPRTAGTPAKGWRLQVSCRPDQRYAWLRRKRKYPVTVTGDRFDVVVPLESLPTPSRMRPVESWDLHLRLPRHAPFRLGAHEDGIENKEKIITFPPQKRGKATIRPLFVNGNHLIIRCRLRGGR